MTDDQELINGLSHVKALETAWRDETMMTQRGTVTAPRDYVYASRRRDCVRAMALDLLHPEDEEPWPVESLERARRGSDRERSIITTLFHVGQRSSPRFSVVEGQKHLVINDRDGTKLLSLKIDGRLRFEDGVVITFEVKSGDSVRHCDTLNDLERSDWTRHHLDQILVYMLAQDERFGLIILDKPEGPTFLLVDLMDHLERAESFLRDARMAVDARFGRVDLPGFTANPALCRRCDHFGKSCAPPLDYGPGVHVISDPRLEGLAKRRDELAAAAKEYESADSELKKALRGVELAVMGDFTIEGKWVGMKRRNVPPEIASQYETYDPRAQFRLKISRIGADTGEIDAETT